jgi:hypothetical protein
VAGYNSLTVLYYLLEGREVELDGEWYKYQDGIFDVVRIRSRQGYPDDEVILKVDYPLSNFIKDCDKIPDEMEHIAVMRANLSLMKIKEDFVKKHVEEREYWRTTT